ncbi:DUF1129 domain-containing protein [Chitinimonas arctica]|uniref:DUF1129 domain-containing protein n=1 Tax=Chitinimonas arctica TaxID=2594795 RepID=A0A516SAZ6_9NEIS|nr:DUF1129 domain-containing protein [Chitinimonas arctica]QDQ25315.1 DUF1129 domain-containing protein [Chitinimonas arctica]
MNHLYPYYPMQHHKPRKATEPPAWQIAVWAVLWLVGWIGLYALVGWLEP